MIDYPPLVALVREPPLAEVYYSTLAAPLAPAALDDVARLLLEAGLRAVVADGLTRACYGREAGFALVRDAEAETLAARLRELLHHNRENSKCA